MSYQHLSNCALVVCDGCGARGAVGDHDWRQMRVAADRTPVHLCPHCRRVAIWCEAHQRYHRPADNHRCTCAECGGLFTTSAASGIICCPSCQRIHAPEQHLAAQLPRAVKPTSIRARLWALFAMLP